MFNREYLEKSPDLRREENIEFWTEFELALQHQRIEVTFKIDNHFYPESMNSIASPYICELLNNKIAFFEFKPQSLNWKNSLSLKLTHLVNEIELVEVSTQKKLDLAMGVFPYDAVTLKVKINYKNGQAYHLYSKSLAVAEKIFEWGNNNGLRIKDKEGTERLLKESTHPIDVIKD